MYLVHISPINCCLKCFASAEMAQCQTMPSGPIDMKLVLKEIVTELSPWNPVLLVA